MKIEKTYSRYIAKYTTKYSSKINRNQQGFTLLEVLISLSILAIALSSLMPVFASLSKFNTKMDFKTKAIAAGQERLEAIRESDHATIPTSGTVDTNHVVDGTPLIAKTTYCKTSSFCTGDNKHIFVEIMHNGNKIHELETVFANFE